MKSKRRTSAALWLASLPMLVSSLATAQTDDPFAPSVPEPAAEPSVMTATVDSTVSAIAGCAELSSSLCERANNTFMMMIAGYVLVLLLVTVPWSIYWSGRGTGGRALKFLSPLLVGAAIAGVAVGFDPFASENYLCCASDPVFRAALLLGESRIARALVMGVLPFTALYFVLVVGIKAARR